MSTDIKEKLKALQLTIDKLDKAYGKGTVMKMGDQKVDNIDALSSGSLSLDIALGIGGYPTGRIIEIYGPESSGKTTLSMHATDVVNNSAGAFLDFSGFLIQIFLISASNPGVFLSTW